MGTPMPLTKRPTYLTLLYDHRERALARFKALVAEPSPWYVEGRYIADATTASLYRGLLIEHLCDLGVLTVEQYEAQVAHRYGGAPPPRAA